jgi:hypothetical protein
VRSLTVAVLAFLATATGLGGCARQVTHAVLLAVDAVAGARRGRRDDGMRRATLAPELATTLDDGAYLGRVVEMGSGAFSTPVADQRVT